MELRLWLSIFFGAGLFFEALLLLRHRLEFKKILGIICLLLLSLILGWLKWGGDTIYESFFVGFIFFALLFGLAFRDEILPKLTEAKLLSFTILFWFLFFVLLRQNMYDLNLLGIAAIIPTALTLLIGFFNFQLHWRLKLICYIWFLIINTVLLFTQLAFKDFTFFFDAKVDIINSTSVFVSGMSFMIIVINLYYLLLLIPFFLYEGTIEERKRDWQEHIGSMVNKFSDYQIKPIYSMFLLLFQGGGVILNYYYQLLPHYFLVNLWVVLIPHVFKEKPVLS